MHEDFLGILERSTPIPKCLSGLEQMGLRALDERDAVSRYSRQDVLRILRLRARQVSAWERAGLIETGESYSFQDLVKLRKLRDLRANCVSVASIRASVDAMQAVSGMSNPLLEATASRRGSRVVFRHSGAVMEPIARQFVFDFDAPAPGELSVVANTNAKPVALDGRVSALFLQAVQLEESGRMDEAAEAYEELLHLDPHHAPSSINLGTICYNRRAFRRAEELYRRATISDPGYALAFFDLGNVLDELERLPDAIEAYRSAIRLVPKYADAHYNLALAYERTGERRRALRHWTLYLKLDPVGPWANHARTQARKILSREKLTIVHRSPWVSRRRPETRSAQASAEHGPGLPA
jgi:tetratricopeptide (TPR) repeat protein